jgi:prepilin peptidase CpaA
MTDPLSVHVLLKALLSGLLIYAAIQDLTRLRIPNALSLCVFALFPAYVMSVPGGFPWVSALLIASSLLVLGVIGFSQGWVGGGDVKLLSATALWAGPDRLLEFLFITALAGGVLALALVAYTRLVGFWTDAAPHAGKLPYGVAIAVGGIAALTIIPALG